MKVGCEELPGTHIERLVVVADDDHHAGEVVAYRCRECHQVDEVVAQIWHREDCSLAGQHGRQHYDRLEPDCDDLDELDPQFEIELLVAAETDAPDGVFNGDVLGFECLECGNCDEDLFELTHDERCPLADCPLERREPVSAADVVPGENIAIDGGG